MTEWEYITGECGPSPQNIQAACADLGRKGWELCGMVSAMKDVTGGMLLKGVASIPPQPVVILTFKRPTDWEAKAEASDYEAASV